jgi:hypothetical protein
LNDLGCELGALQALCGGLDHTASGVGMIREQTVERLGAKAGHGGLGDGPYPGVASITGEYGDLTDDRTTGEFSEDVFRSGVSYGDDLERAVANYEDLVGLRSLVEQHHPGGEFEEPDRIDKSGEPVRVDPREQLCLA